jgi:hypothetical protein
MTRISRDGLVRELCGPGRAGHLGRPNEPQAAWDPDELSHQTPACAGTACAGTEPDPFCQACAPADIAALAWVHLILASSLGGTPISLIHRRVVDSRWPPPTARPASTIMVPPPTITALVIRVATWNWGPLLRSSSSLIASSFARNLVITVIGRMVPEIILSG